jgi:hypothetical protein
MILPIVIEGASGLVAAAALAVGLFAVRRARVLAAQTEKRALERCDELRDAGAELRNAVENQAAQLAQLAQEQIAQQQIMVMPGLPRAGMNLSKRSQVLRMHRRGDGPDRIAAALELPQQEVELLIKVHRLVIASL